MNRCTRVCVVVSIGWLLGAGLTRAHSARRAHVTARVYDTFAVAGQELSTAERTAEAVFRDAGVTVRWRRCPRPPRPLLPSADRCDDVVQPTEVLLRLGTAPAPVNPLVLGYSLVDRQTRTGTLSTVYVDHIHQLAARLRINRGTLLGVTIAHEMGHVLLGSAVHGTEGLMRAHWPDAAFRGRLTREWRFSSAEISQMTSALEARTTAAAVTQLSVLPLTPDAPIGPSR